MYSLHSSNAYIQKKDDELFFCHLPHRVMIPGNPIELYDKNGKFIKKDYRNNIFINLEVKNADYIKAKDRCLKPSYSYDWQSDIGTELKFEPEEEIEQFYISYNYKPIRINICFELNDGAWSRSNDRLIMDVIEDYFNDHEYPHDRLIKCFDSDYGPDLFHTRSKYRGHEDRTINNSYLLELIGYGGKGAYYKIHKTLEPLFNAEFDKFKDGSIENPYDLKENNLRFLKKYLGTEYRKFNEQEKIDFSIKYLENCKLYEENAKRDDMIH